MNNPAFADDTLDRRPLHLLEALPLFLLVSKSTPSCPLVLVYSENNASECSANIGAIVGGVLSGILVLVVASASYYCLKHRRRRAQAHLSPMPTVTQSPPLYQPRTPAKLAGQAPYNPPHDGPPGANSRISSQNVLPFYHNTHSRSDMPPVVPSGTLITPIGTSQDPSMSESVLHPTAPFRQRGHYDSGHITPAILSPEDEIDERGLVSRRYSPLSLPPPYTPNPV